MKVREKHILLAINEGKVAARQNKGSDRNPYLFLGDRCKHLIKAWEKGWSQEIKKMSH